MVIKAVNKLTGKITDIHSSGSFSIVSIKLPSGTIIRSIIMETPESADYLLNGNSITAIFKETEVVISTETNSAVSILNRIPGSIEDLAYGELLSRLKIKTADGILSAVITSEAVRLLNLKVGKEVMAMVELNEIMLSR
ncbi:MAG: tobe domain protein [Bacteroidetes bacterium]|nr:tobe domain protein [Bacteroidota bacterium]